MKNILAILACFISATVTAAPCDRPNEFGAEYSPHTIQYVSVKKQPGETFMLGGRKYVMKRLPFTEFSTNARYAITVPAELLGGSTVSTSDVGYISVRHITSNYCSDVAVVGRSNPVHKLPISEERGVVHRVIDDLLGNNDGTIFYVDRVVSVNLNVQIGATRLTHFLAISKREIPQTTLNRVDHDMTNDINWSALNHWPFPEIYELNQLVDYVYITKL